MIMQIEIAEHGRMTLTGSSLFDSIQNKHTPILDLLVRESIQNSLDAAVPNIDCVKVGFLLGQFTPSKVNNLLEGVSRKLDEQYPNDSYSYIAICDSNTVGLTGPLHIDDVDDNQNYGNLIKLIYEISKPQTQEGAGGSWGLGKTIYFRVGIGLVFYYSRIKNENGKYESRLAVAFVEDERQDNSVIPLLEGSKIKRGIAWWGQARGTNSTCPLTNEEEIKTILSYFGISPYQDESTGTIVIIPYINERKLLENNRPNVRDEDDFVEEYYPAPWYDSIEEYLKIAVQRWYAPRLNNSLYNGTYLNVAINGKRIKKDDFDPIFSIFQELYNIGIDPKQKDCSECHCEDILIRTVLSKGSVAGRVVFKTVSQQDLKMCNPDNKQNPQTYCNLEIHNEITNKPLLAFTRKPGMIVAYKNAGAWLDGVPSTEEERFLIALFILNSDNALKDCNGISLEEYIRKSEHADHSSWNDHSNQRIVSKIKNGVSKKLSNALKRDEKEIGSTKDSTFSRILGDLILPKSGFGKKPNPDNKRNNGKEKTSTNSNLCFSIDFTKTKYADSFMEIHADWSSNAHLTNAMLALAIESESGAIKAEEWENGMGLKMPFEIEEVSLFFSKSKGFSSENNLSVSKNKKIDSIDSCSLEVRQTPKGYSDVINLHFDNPSSFKASVKIKIKFLDLERNKKPTFLLGKEQ